MDINTHAAALSNQPANIIIQHPDEEYVVEDSVSMTFWDTPKYVDLIREYRERHSGHPNMALFRLGDEQMEDTSEMYTHVDYILRVYATFPGKHDYWNATTWWDRSLNKVIWIPNGYAAGAGPQDERSLLLTSRRNILCYFAGGGSRTREFVSSRLRMFEVLDETNTGSIIKDFLGALEYKVDLGNTMVGGIVGLADTQYGLAPAGSVPETVSLTADPILRNPRKRGHANHRPGWLAERRVWVPPT